MLENCNLYFFDYQINFRETSMVAKLMSVALKYGNGKSLLLKYTKKFSMLVEVAVYDVQKSII